jgi:hypothetical protein
MDPLCCWLIGLGVLGIALCFLARVIEQRVWPDPIDPAPRTLSDAFEIVRGQHG